MINTRIQKNTILGVSIIAISVLAAGQYVFDRLYLPKSELVAMGMPYEGATIASLQAIAEVKTSHPHRVDVTYIPYFISDGKKITIPENFQTPEELIEDTINEGIFIQELLQKSPRQALDYLKARASNRDTLEWETFALYVDENLQSLINDIENNQSEYAKNYEEDYEFVDTFIKENQIQSPSISATLLNGDIHNLGTAPTSYTLRTSITKTKLRNESSLYGESDFANIFGLQFASATPQLDGFNEAYQEVDCNDRPIEYGMLKDVSTPYVRCEYTPAEELDVKIVYFNQETSEEPQEQPSNSTDQQAEQIVRRFLQANFKNITLSTHQEIEYNRDISITKPLDGTPAFSVLLDDEVLNTPPYSLFSTQQLIMQLSEDKYYLDLEKILQF